MQDNTGELPARVLGTPESDQERIDRQKLATRKLREAAKRRRKVALLTEEQAGTTPPRARLSKNATPLPPRIKP